MPELYPELEEAINYVNGLVSVAAGGGLPHERFMIVTNESDYPVYLKPESAPNGSTIELSPGNSSNVLIDGIWDPRRPDEVYKIPGTTDINELGITDSGIEILNSVFGYNTFSEAGGGWQGSEFLQEHGDWGSFRESSYKSWGGGGASPLMNNYPMVEGPWNNGLGGWGGIRIYVQPKVRLKKADLGRHIEVIVRDLSKISNRLKSPAITSSK
ncbi:MAG: hypothetical protein EOP04_00270 [Proteobacteria bacterium]|nr:MAG: hypothetical protein EOP04_00270 [Pseudomonadota bacterium]